MNQQDKKILVIGATGNQGGAVVRHLYFDGWQVRALTRDPSKPESRKLEDAGMEVVQGDINDKDSVLRCLEGCYGVFSVQQYWGQGAEKEIHQGRAIAEAAKEAGVQHLVYSSVGGAERHTGIPHFESKWEIEEYIRQLEIPNTILRPVFFMENFNHQMRDAIMDGMLNMPLLPEKTLQMIATDDIGGFAALAFDDPDKFKGMALEIAGDEMTLLQAADLMSWSAKRPIRYVEQSIDELSDFNRETGLMFQWLNREGFKADIPYLKTIYPELTSFESWLKHTTWDKIEV